MKKTFAEFKKMILEDFKKLNLIYFEKEKCYFSHNKRNKWLVVRLSFDLPKYSMDRLIDYCKKKSLSLSFNDGMIEVTAFNNGSDLKEVNVYD